MRVTKFVPERLYEDCLLRSEVYHQLSRRHASEGDYYEAVNAQWFSDSNIILALLWQRVIIASHNPDEKLPQLTNIIYTSFRRKMISDGEYDIETLGELLEIARENSYQAFDNSARKSIQNNYKNIEHLADLNVDKYLTASNEYASNIDLPQINESIIELKTKSLENFEQYKSFVDSGEIGDAIDALWNSYWRAFEAYLRQSALSAGDVTLMTVSLRENCAYEIANSVGDFSDDIREAEDQMIEILAKTLGVAEEERLFSYISYVQQISFDEDKYKLRGRVYDKNRVNIQSGE